SGKLKKRTYIFPVVFPVADRIGIFLPPFFLNRFQFRKSCGFIGCVIHSLEVCRKLLQIVIIHIFKRIAQHMDYTALDLCLWENGLDCIFKSGEAVYAEKQHILHATVFQVVEHSEPELTGLIRSYGNTENILVSFHGNSQYNISSAAEDPAVFPDFVMDTVHKNKR